MSIINEDNKQSLASELDCDCGSGLKQDQCCHAPERTALNAPVYARWTPAGVSTLDDTPVTTPIAAAIEQLQIPDLFAAELNVFREKLYFVKMTPTMLRASVFLDPPRIQAGCVVESDMSVAAAKIAQLKREQSSYIFHTAFCGSTLMTQALDAMYLSLSLREPDLLGNVYYHFYIKDNANKDSPWLDYAITLLARRYQEDETTVIKVNDYVNALMEEFSRRHDSMPMLFMYTPVEEFFAACIKADNRKQWIAQRVRNLRNPITTVLPAIKNIAFDENDPASTAAIYWSYNIALYLRAYEQCGDQLMSVDFNQLLSSPAQCIDDCARHLKLRARANVNKEQALESLFGSYSKNANYRYSPELRQQDILQKLQSEATGLERVQSLSALLLAEYDYQATQLLPGEWLADVE